MSAQKSSGGIGFGGALVLLFIGLKLGGLIQWSWLWVLCPIWIPLAFAALCFGIYGVLLLCESPADRRHRELRDLARKLRAAR